MSSFAPGGPEIPEIPIDIPVPDIPPADFATAEKRSKQGSKDSGFWEWLLDLILNWIPSLLARIIGFLFGCFGVIVAWVLRKFTEVRTSGEFGVNEVAAAAVSDLFGVQVSAGILGPGGSPASKEAMGTAISQAILNSIGAGAPTGGDGTLQPSAAGAQKFLATAANLAVEGWLEGFAFELVTAGQVETFAELKDIMASALGLGRIARRVLAPPLKTLVVDPYTWLLHRTYKPTLLAVSEQVRAYIKGQLTRAQLDDAASYWGYTSDKVDTLIAISSLHISPGDLGALVDRGQIAESDALAEIQAQGYDAHSAAALLFIARKARPEAMERTFLDTAITGLADGKITRDAVEQYINGVGLPDSEKQLYVQLADLKVALHQTRPSMSQGVSLVEAGIWNLDDFRTLATYYGYSPADEQALELLTLTKVKNASDAAAKKSATAAATAAKQKAAAAAAAAKAAAAVAAAESKGVSTAQYEALVKDGLKTVAQYSAYLTGKGIAADNVTALTTALQTKLAAAKTAGGVSAAAAASLKAKNLSIAQLESAVKDGAITIQEYTTRLEQAGVSADDAGILATVLQDTIDTAKAKASATATAKATASVKKVNLAQFETAVREGLKSIDDYAAFLKAAGYDDSDETLLVSELNAQLAKDQAAAKLATGATTKATAKGLDLAQLQAAVRAGLRPIADYQAALVTLGYNAADQTALVGLLQLQVDHDKTVASAAKTAATLVKGLGVTLAELERAVVLGVVPMSTLTDALTRAKVSTDEATLLTSTVQAEAATAAAARNKANAAAALVAKQGLTLASLEADAIAGKVSTSQLAGILQSAGVVPEDVASILQLVVDETANQKAVDSLASSASTKAAGKGLSLSEEQAAVKAGVKTIDDYRAFVAGLGFDPADVDTLVNTLGHNLKLAGY
jgi:hypothetical protein